MDNETTGIEIATPAEARNRFLSNKLVFGLTTIPRKKMIIVLSVDTTNPVKLVIWKRHTYIIPSYMVGSTFCLERQWIFEIRLENGKVLYCFTDCETRFSGGWQKTPSCALKVAYFAATGKRMKDSHNGRAEVGLYSKPMRAFLAAVCSRLLPEHLRQEYENEELTLHLDIDQELMNDHPLVVNAGQPIQPSAIEQHLQEHEHGQPTEDYDDDIVDCKEEDDQASVASYLGLVQEECDFEDLLMDLEAGMDDQPASKRVRMHN